MRKTFLTLFFQCFIGYLFAQQLNTVYEKTNGTQTPTYFEIINWWKKADALSPLIQMVPMGTTDASFPLHLITISSDGNHQIKAAKAAHKTIILINNGIHPGEPNTRIIQL